LLWLYRQRHISRFKLDQLLVFTDERNTNILHGHRYDIDTEMTLFLNVLFYNRLLQVFT